MALRSTAPRLPRTPRERPGLLLGLALVLLNLILLNVIAGRHYARLDWTSSRVFSLSPQSRNVLAGLTRPVKITLFMVPPLERGQRTLYPETLELLERFAASTQQVSLERVDPDASPTRTKVLSATHQINAEDLRRGVVVLRSGERTRFVPSSALVERDPATGAMAYRGESALLDGLIAVVSRKSPMVCFSTGHGEAPIDSHDREGYSAIAIQVRRESYRVTNIGAAELADGAGVCQALIIGGAVRAFAPVELDGIHRFLRRGGRLLVLMGPVMDRQRTRFIKTGLEALLLTWGVELAENIVVDPMAVPGEPPLLTWATEVGYSSHPVARSMKGRLTVWPLTREVRAATALRAGLTVSPLVVTSARGWGETDLRSFAEERPLALDPATDTRGPVTVALAVQGGDTRLIVMGTERGLLNIRQARPVIGDFNRDLFMSSLTWILGQESRIGVSPRSLEHVRLALDQRALGRVFLVTVVALPLCSLFAGVYVWWRRRR